MKGRVSQGFTIIEVTLFLSITGLMIAGLMVGTSAAVNRQRYSDAVTSLQSDIQSLYSDAESVANTRPRGTCSVVTENGVSGVVVSENAGVGPSTTDRGQSDCIIMGKALIIDGSKKVSSMYDVIGREPAATATASDELSAIISSYPTVYKKSRQDYPLKWDTSIYAGAENAGGVVTNFQMGVAIYVVRSPVSGSAYTFTVPMAYNAFSWQDDTTNTTWAIRGAGNVNSAEVFNGNTMGAVQVGVHPCGLVSDGASMRLRIAGRASGASAVTFMPQTGMTLPDTVRSAC